MRRNGILLAGAAVVLLAPLAAASPPAAAADAGPIGFAAVDALGQNGTTGGAGGPVVTVTTAAQLIDYAARTGPYVIQVSGTLTLPTGKSDGMYPVTSDKTIVGLGSTARIEHGGLTIGLPVDDDVTTVPANAVHNIIIRNLSFSGATDDAINVQMFSHHLWIDHNDLCCGDDGAVDIKRGSDYVTVSWNRTHDHDKTFLLGHDDDNAAQDVGHLRVTYHHNFFDGSDQRNPRVRFGDPVHVFNNYCRNASYWHRLGDERRPGGRGQRLRHREQPGPGRLLRRSRPARRPRQHPDQDCTTRSRRAAAWSSPARTTPTPLDPAADVPALVSAGAGVGHLSEEHDDRLQDPNPARRADRHGGGERAAGAGVLRLRRGLHRAAAGFRWG